MFRNLKIGRNLVLLGIVFTVRSPCCCSHSSRSKTSRSTSARTNAGVPNRSSRFDDCSMTSRSIRSRFLANRLMPLRRRGRSWRIFDQLRRWMVVTEKNLKEPTALLDCRRNGLQQNPWSFAIQCSEVGYTFLWSRQLVQLFNTMLSTSRTVLCWFTNGRFAAWWYPMHWTF